MSHSKLTLPHSLSNTVICVAGPVLSSLCSDTDTVACGSCDWKSLIQCQSVHRFISVLCISFFCHSNCLIVLLTSPQSISFPACILRDCMSRWNSQCPPFFIHRVSGSNIGSDSGYFNVFRVFFVMRLVGWPWSYGKSTCYRLHVFSLSVWHRMDLFSGVRRAGRA
jgi:hypothetical protein